MLCSSFLVRMTKVMSAGFIDWVVVSAWPAGFTPPSSNPRRDMTLALVLASALLRPCGDASPWYCGQIVRPLDPSGTIHASIGIHFEWLPHRDGKARAEGVIVA